MLKLGGVWQFPVVPKDELADQREPVDLRPSGQDNVAEVQVRLSLRTHHRLSNAPWHA